jgi:HlyD family secretion protein
VLAELDTDRLEATVASSRARVDAAEARVAETAATIEEKRGDYERKQRLAEQQVTSVQDLAVAKAAYDRAVAAHSHALAEVNVAKADLELNETNLAKTCICSPITGVVLERNVDPGQTVAASLQAPVLFTIAEDLKQMELQVDVDEADVGKTVVGQKATFTVDAYPGRRFPAEIRDIRFASETVQGVVTYKAMLITDNSELLLRPGMTATAEIVVREVENALLVPNAALRFSPPLDREDRQSVSFLKRIIPGMPSFRPASRPEEGGPDRTIWVLRDGAPAAVPIQVGASDGRSTELVEGDIANGDQVIIDTR